MNNDNLSSQDIQDEIDIINSVKTNPMNFKGLSESKISLIQILEARNSLIESSEDFIQGHIDRLIENDQEHYLDNKETLDPLIDKAKKELVLIRNQGIENGKLIYSHSEGFTFFLYALDKNGNRSNLDEFDRINTKSSFFKRWFLNSKMSNVESGEPKIAYHGSPRNFKSFNEDAPGERRWRNKGIHFSEKKELVEQYSKKAYKALEIVLKDIFISQNEGKKPSYWSEFVSIQRIRNTLVLDLADNKTKSKYYNCVDRSSGKIERIEYGGNRRGIERLFEIFGGEWPNNKSLKKKAIDGGNYFMKEGIGSYLYECYLNSQNPMVVKSDNLDNGFEQVENSEDGNDGGIVISENGISGDGGIIIPNTEGSENYSVFLGNQAKSTSNILFLDNGRLFW